MSGKQRFEVGAVDLRHGAEEMARERAEQYFTDVEADARQKGFWARTLNSVIVQNLFREAFRQNQLGRARQDILRDRSWHGADDDGRHLQQQAEQALIEHLLQWDEESRLEKQTEFRALAQEEARQQLQEAVTRAVKDQTVTPESFAVEAREIIDRAFAAQGQATPWMAHNAWGVVERLRALHNHGTGLDLADIEIGLTIGRLRTDARTEQEQTGVDQLIEKLNSRTGLVSGLVNETTVAVGIAALSNFVSLAGKTAAGKAAALAGGLMGASAVSATLAAYKEGRRLDRERWLHARQHAAGLEEQAREDLRAEEVPEAVRAQRQDRITKLQRERDELRPWHLLRRRAIDAEIASLETRPAAPAPDRRLELQRTQVETASAQESLRFIQESLNAPQESWNNPLWRQQVQQQLIELDAREAASIALRRDFFRYSADAPVPVQRLELLKTRAALRVRLQEAAAGGRDWASDFRAAVIAQRRAFEQMAEQKDKEYATYRATMQRLAGRQAAISGLVIGTVVQTALGAVSSKVTSPLEALAKYVQSWWSPAEGAPALTAPPAEVHQALQQAAAPFSETPVSSPKEAVLPPTLATEHIARDVFYSNAQPHTVADHNELRLTWGGNQGQTTLPSGEQAFVLDISGMKDNQSWYNGHPKVGAATAIKAGKAMILLVPEGAAREQAVVISVNADGRAVIPSSSPAAQLFAVEDGKTVFKGFRVEAVLALNEQAGTRHVGVLASFTGDGVWQTPHTQPIEEVANSPLPPVPAPVPEVAPPEVILPSEAVLPKVEPEIVPDLPYTIPVRGRQGLRQTRRTARQETIRAQDIVPPLFPPAPPLPPPPVRIAPPMLLEGESEPVNLQGTPETRRSLSGAGFVADAALLAAVQEAQARKQAAQAEPQPELLPPEAGTQLIPHKYNRILRALEKTAGHSRDLHIDDLYQVVFGHDRAAHSFTAEEQEVQFLISLYEAANTETAKDAIYALNTDLYGEYRRREDGGILRAALEKHQVIRDFVLSEQRGRLVGRLRRMSGIASTRRVIDKLYSDTNLSQGMINTMNDRLAQYEQQIKQEKKERETFSAYEKEHPGIIELLDFGQAARKQWKNADAIKATFESGTHAERKGLFTWFLQQLRALTGKKNINANAVNSYLENIIGEHKSIPPEAYPDTRTEKKINAKVQLAVNCLKEFLLELERREAKKKKQETQPLQPAVDWNSIMQESLNHFTANAADMDARWPWVSDLVNAAHQAGAEPTAQALYEKIAATVPVPAENAELLQREINEYLLSYEEQFRAPFGQQSAESRSQVVP
jgi:hypothetical protein